MLEHNLDGKEDILAIKRYCKHKRLWKWKFLVLGRLINICLPGIHRSTLNLPKKGTDQILFRGMTVGTMCLLDNALFFSSILDRKSLGKAK